MTDHHRSGNDRANSMIRIAAVADLHVRTSTPLNTLRERFEHVGTEADVLLLAGDLTDNGSLEEAELLVAAVQHCGIPVVAVYGNHDYIGRNTKALSSFYGDHGVTVLDGEVFTTAADGVTLGIAGAKGFQGGFGEYALAALGEPEADAWVDLAKEEAMKVETALSSLDTDYRVVLLHYAPVLDTVIGEAPEVYGFRGSDHLCAPIDRLGANMVVHGHAHYGTHRGSTPRGIPVYNVAAKVIKRPYALLELGP